MTASSRINNTAGNGSTGKTRGSQSSDISTQPRRRVCCAIYTRKSSEDGLEQEFNSLDAQREASEAYILSQKHDGWVAMPDFYDDCGLSGGTLERPALKRLLEDVSAGKVDVIVVYKVDRLTRSLSDFARIVDTLDKHQVSFVSVTQHFNTTSSMGRLTLNVLLSFAQFEREIAGERIRDKIAASKRKGMWMGGTIPFGYQVKDRKLEIVESEATTLRLIYETYAKLGTVEALMEYMSQQGISNQRECAVSENANLTAEQSSNQAIDKLAIRSGDQSANQSAGQTIPTAFSRAALYHTLKNPLYIGKITHKGAIYDGLHQPIIGDALWAKVQQQIAVNTSSRICGRRSKHPSLLVGKVVTENGQILTPTHAVKSGVRYRYYANPRSTGKLKSKGASVDAPVTRIPAPAIERLVVDRLQALLRSQTELADALEALNLSAGQLRDALGNAKHLADDWSTKAAADQRALLQGVLIKVCLKKEHVELSLSRRGLLQTITDMTEPTATRANATTLQPNAVSEDDTIILATTKGFEPSGNGLCSFKASSAGAVIPLLLTI